jgi:hypothetical protein
MELFKIETPQRLKRFVSNGRIFSVTFIKKNGEERTMLARTGVTKHLKGGTRMNNNPDHLVVWSMRDNGYRTINLETITKLKANGTEYQKLV